MTTEVKAMVDALPVVSHAIIDWNETELVAKSDVIELVEKLTKPSEQPYAENEVKYKIIEFIEFMAEEKLEKHGIEQFEIEYERFKAQSK